MRSYCIEKSVIKKSTPQQLKEIRERLQNENRKNQRVKIVFVIAFAIVATILLIIFNFVTF